MDFVKDLGRKRESKKINHFENKNVIENYNALVEKYNEINTFSQGVVEKHNILVEKYNQYVDVSMGEISKYQEEIKMQKESTQKIENKFIELQKHVDKLLDSYQNLEKENTRLEEVNKSLEKYIEIMDKSQNSPVKNERGAGRKKKYSKEQIDRILELKSQGKEYTEIVDALNQEFEEKQWGIKEIKYVFTRYKDTNL
ncbi:MAG: hypothetical protein WBH44_03725 [Proteocatella sp.]